MFDKAEPYLVPSYSRPESIKKADGIVLPGGFSYGDYIRAGAVASVGEILDWVRELAAAGKPVLGICNGFQILCETGILPGALLHNANARFICKWIRLQVTDDSSLFTEGIEGKTIRVPIAHAEGNYYCTNDDMKNLQEYGGILFKYCNSNGDTNDSANPNGSIANIAGVRNKQGNVMGMMPHPERASREALGSTDGRAIIENFVRATRMK
jgi:phosphoribosylformylglycinamidine synthase